MPARQKAGMKSKRPPRLVFNLAWTMIVMPLWIYPAFLGGWAGVAVCGIFVGGFVWAICRWLDVAPPTEKEQREDALVRLMDDGRNY
jgi:hypothetical protein